jgi:hypothetical protein
VIPPIYTFHPCGMRECLERRGTTLVHTIEGESTAVYRRISAIEQGGALMFWAAAHEGDGTVRVVVQVVQRVAAQGAETNAPAQVIVH